MATVLESPLKTNNMLLVVRINLFELVKDLHFLEPCSIPVKDISCVSTQANDKRNVHRFLVSHDLDSYFFACIADLSM